MGTPTLEAKGRATLLWSHGRRVEELRPFPCVFPSSLLDDAQIVEAELGGRMLSQLARNLGIRCQIAQQPIPLPLPWHAPQLLFDGWQALREARTPSQIKQQRIEHSEPAHRARE